MVSKHRGRTSVVVGAVLLATGCAGSSGIGGGGGELAEDASQPAAGRAALAQDKPAQLGSAGPRGTSAVPIVLTERQVIRTGNLVVQTRDVIQAIQRARSIANAARGFVESEQTEANNRGRVTRSYLVLRVPTGDFDAVIGQLEELGTTQLLDTGTQDVTRQVVDVESRIENLQRSIERLRLLLDRAKSIGQVIRLESELTAREGELESLQGQYQLLTEQTTLATISLTLQEPPSKPEPKPRPDDRGFLVGLDNGWQALLASLAVLATVVGALLPFVAVAAVVGLPLWLWLRGRSRRRAAPAATADAG